MEAPLWSMVGEMFTGKNKYKDRENDREVDLLKRKTTAQMEGESAGRAKAIEDAKYRAIPAIMESQGVDAVEANKIWASSQAAGAMKDANEGFRQGGYRPYSTAVGAAEGEAQHAEGMERTDKAKFGSKEYFANMQRVGGKVQADMAEDRMRQENANAKAAAAVRDTMANTQLLEGQATNIAQRNLFDADSNDYNMRVRPAVGIERLAREAEATGRATTANKAGEMAQSMIDSRKARSDRDAAVMDADMAKQIKELTVKGMARGLEMDDAYQEAESIALRMRKVMGNNRATTASPADATPKPVIGGGFK